MAYLALYTWIVVADSGADEVPSLGSRWRPARVSDVFRCGGAVVGSVHAQKSALVPGARVWRCGNADDKARGDVIIIIIIIRVFAPPALRLLHVPVVYAPQRFPNAQNLPKCLLISWFSMTFSEFIIESMCFVSLIGELINRS